MKNLLTTRQLCERLNVTRQAVYKWRKAGCPTVVGAPLCRYDYEEVIAWLNGRRAANA